MLPDEISAASENSVGTFTTPSDSPLHLVLTSDYPNHSYAMTKYWPYRGRVKIEYCSRKGDEKNAKSSFYCSTFSGKDKKLY